MLLQKSPNSWSCFPTAFAMALDLPVEELIAELGHDGSSEYWEGYKLSWHVQEIAKVCYDVYNTSVLQLEAVTLAAPTPGHKPYEQIYDLSPYYGVYAGVAGVHLADGRRHALAFSEKIFYNPSTGQECSLKDVQVNVVWLLSSLI